MILWKNLKRICIIIFIITFALNNNIIFNKNENKLENHKSLRLKQDDSNDIVVEQLNNQIERFNSELNETLDDKKKENLQSLISKTQYLLEKYYENKTINENEYSLFYVPVNPDDIEVVRLCSLIAEAIAAFNTLGYLLSAELLTYAFNNNNENNVYTPLYINRVYSSNKMYNILSGTKEKDIEIFEYNGCRNEKDLYFAIKHFEFRKTNEMIYLTDKYDFDFCKDPQNPVDLVVNEVVKAQNKGIIVPFHIEACFNLTEPIKLTPISKSGNTWNIEIENMSNYSKRVFYNEKMCFENDARNWEGLTNIKLLELKPNSKALINVAENGFATHMTISFFKDNERIITFADEINLDSNISVEISKKQKHIYDNVLLIGKDEDNWILEITNNYDYGRSVEYNEKMCFENDAKNWDNLNNKKINYFYVGESLILRIKENGTAQFVAIRIMSETYEERIVLHNLNANGTMSVERIGKNLYKYLQVSISQKNGNKWEIFVTNMINEDIIVEYNEKMCFENDAKNWNNLNDIKSISLRKYGTAIISIQENWFATHIAISYCYNNRRLITYGKNLSTDGSIYILENYLEI